LIERLLRLLPAEVISRTILFDPGDPDFVPLFNPLNSIPGQDIGRTADELVTAIKSFVGHASWGDRLEHLLKNMIFSLMHIPGTTFLDLSNLLRNKSRESNQFSKEILQVLDNESVRQFWLHDYLRYGKDDLGPPRNKLSKLLISGPVSRMLSQPISLFNFRQIMDDGMILLIILSTVGPTVKEALGSFFLALFQLAALSRSEMPIEERKAFHLYCDEAHRFLLSDAIEDLIAETRKFGVSLTLAHQFISQFGWRKTDALASVGSTIVFNVDTKDAEHLRKDLQKLANTDHIITLKRGEAIARVETDIVRIKTPKPREIPSENSRERIIEESRRRYYKPPDEVRELIRQRSRVRHAPSRGFDPVVVAPAAKNVSEELSYDEFC